MSMKEGLMLFGGDWEAAFACEAEKVIWWCGKLWNVFFLFLDVGEMVVKGGGALICYRGS